MGDFGYRDDDRLALGEERSLPWLASGLEDEEADDGIDTRRVAILAGIAIAVLVVLAATFWFFSSATGDPAQNAHGEVIAAPEGPYKIRPENPGGREFERTGDAAPEAAEGQTQQIQLKGSAAAPQPQDEAPVEQAAPPKPGIGVQLGAYRTQSRAEQAWAELSDREPLAGRDYRIVRARADIGTVYRLQVPVSDLGSANALCGEIRAAGMDCQVRR